MTHHAEAPGPGQSVNSAAGAGASSCQPPHQDGDQPQPGGGGARAGRPGLRGHVPGGHPGQAGQSDAQGARPCCLSTIYHLPSDTKTIQHSLSLAYPGFVCFRFLLPEVDEEYIEEKLKQQQYGNMENKTCQLLVLGQMRTAGSNKSAM